MAQAKKKRSVVKPFSHSSVKNKSEKDKLVEKWLDIGIYGSLTLLILIGVGVFLWNMSGEADVVNKSFEKQQQQTSQSGGFARMIATFAAAINSSIASMLVFIFIVMIVSGFVIAVYRLTRILK